MGIDNWVKILQACSPVLVALIGLIPTIIINRKKTQESIGKLQKALEGHVNEDEDEKARSRRYRILRFYDEMCEHKNHSESHFEDVLDDIDKYEIYCKSHKDFKNNRGEAAMAYIKQTYAKVKVTGGFLTHNKGE